LDGFRFAKGQILAPWQLALLKIPMIKQQFVKQTPIF
jgi:hypothetical protein